MIKNIKISLIIKEIYTKILFILIRLVIYTFAKIVCKYKLFYGVFGNVNSCKIYGVQVVNTHKYLKCDILCPSSSANLSYRYTYANIWTFKINI